MTSIFYKNKNQGFFPFVEQIKNKQIAVVFDRNTQPFAKDFISNLNNNLIKELFFDEENLVPDESVYEPVIKKTKDVDLILCVGSGSLNDVCKYASKINDIECAVLATACSMDGYLSKGSALMVNGKKVTLESNAPIAILVDTNILANAPKDMTAAGFGDIIGKYTALMDWHLSNILNNEPIHQEAYLLMEKALNDVVNSYDKLLSYDYDAIEKLMDALIVAGTSMAICGNSRPASGSEHHISHYLEMDFNNRGLIIPPHGVKVAMGCLVCLDLYNYLLTTDIPHKDQIELLVKNLPMMLDVEKMLKDIGCPTKFSEIGVDEELLKRTLLNAYTVRPRFTILTYMHEKNLWNDKLINYIVERHL